MKKILSLIAALLITTGVFANLMPAYAGSRVPVVFKVQYESNVLMAKYDINGNCSEPRRLIRIFL